MLRKFGLVLLVTAFILSACGRQVTPNKNGGASGLSSGYMQYKFRVAQPFNFTKYTYVVVFNTSGNGVTPLPFGTRTNFAGYSFAIQVTQSGTGVSASVGQYIIPNGATFPTFQPYTVPGQLLQLQLNSNGPTEFTVSFNRAIAASILKTTPSPSPSSTPTATPTPSSSASPSPTSSPTATPVPGLAAVWLANFFVTDNTANGVIVDSLGPGGANDTSYISPQYDTTTNFDVPIYVQTGNHPSDAAAQIANSEMLNTP